MLFTSCELDPNGPLEFNDFLVLCKRFENPLPPDEQIKVMFKTYDADEDEKITMEELLKKYKPK